MELVRNQVFFNLGPYEVKEKVNKNQPNRGASYFVRGPDGHKFYSIRDEDEESLLQALYSNVNEDGYKSMDPNSPLNFMNELWETENRFFLDMESKNERVLTKTLLKEIVNAFTEKFHSVFEIRGSEFYPMCFSYVLLRQYYVDFHEQLEEFVLVPVEGKFHIIWPFVIVEKKILQKVIASVLEEHPEYSTFVDTVAADQGKLRMPYMMTKDKKTRALKHKGAFYMYNPRSWRYITGQPVLGAHDIVFRKENRKKKLREYKVVLNPDQRVECLIHLCTIRKHPNQDTERWRARIRPEAVQFFGLSSADSRNDLLYSTLNEAVPRHDFFEDPMDVFNWKKCVQFLRLNRYDEDDDSNIRDIRKILVAYLNRYWTVIVVDGNKVMIAEKHVKWENGRSMVFFDLKTHEQHCHKHAHENLWEDSESVDSKGKQKDPKQYNIAKIWFTHPDRSQHDRITYNPFPSGHQKAVREEVLNCFSNSIICQDQLKDGGNKYTRDDALPWLDLLWRVHGKDDKQFYDCLNWFTHKYHFPWMKIGTVLAWFGPPGIGKTEIIRVVGHIFGSNYLYNNDLQALMTSQGASDLMRNKLLVYLDEATKGRKDIHDRVVQVLKGWITNTGNTLLIRPLYLNGIMMENCLDFIMSTQIKEAIPKEPNDRRYMLQKCVAPYKFKSKEQKQENWAKWIKWVEEDNFSGAHKVATLLESPERLKEMQEVFKFGPFHSVENEIEDSDQQDLTMNSCQGWVKNMVEEGINKHFYSIEDWRTVEQFAGSRDESNLFSTGKKLMNDMEVDLTSEEQCEDWMLLDMNTGDRRYGASVKSMKGDEVANLWNSFSNVWVCFLSQYDIYREYQNWCHYNGHGKPLGWPALKEVLKESRILKFRDQTNKPERVRFFNHRWKQQEEENNKKKKKDAGDSTSIPRVQADIYYFRPLGKARKKISKWLRGYDKKFQTQIKYPEWPLNVLKKHSAPYFLWNTPADTCPDEEQQQPQDNQDDLSFSQDLFTETRVCCRCNSEMTIYPGKELIQNHKKEIFCSQICMNLHVQLSISGATPEKCHLCQKMFILSAGHNLFKQTKWATLYFCSPQCELTYNEDYSGYQSPAVEEEDESDSSQLSF
jgi:hypothetical protein